MICCNFLVVQHLFFFFPLSNDFIKESAKHNQPQIKRVQLLNTLQRVYTPTRVLYTLNASFWCNNHPLEIILLCDSMPLTFVEFPLKIIWFLPNQMLQTMAIHTSSDNFLPLCCRKWESAGSSLNDLQDKPSMNLIPHNIAYLAVKKIIVGLIMCLNPLLPTCHAKASSRK
jgi:hypothetical protein